MEIFKFDCKRNNALAYICSKPGDNSGKYVRLEDYERLTYHKEALEHVIRKISSTDEQKKRFAEEILDDYNNCRRSIVEEAQNYLEGLEGE